MKTMMMTTRVSKGADRTLRAIGVAALMLSCAAGRAWAQSATTAPDRDVRRIRAEVEAASAQARAQTAAAVDQARAQAAQAADQAVIAMRADMAWGAARRQNVPQDVRIMQTIVRTALSQVEPPERPKQPADSMADSTGTAGWAPMPDVYVTSGQSGSYVFGGGNVSGFYMKGYGYLFTVHWPVGSSFSIRSLPRAARSAGRIQVLEDRFQQDSAWSAQYRQRLSEALRDVIAGYGSTLRRAQPGEAITFIADFGGGDSANVTMTVKADALHGTDANANRAAVRVSTGQSGASPELRTQLKIMSQIIDTSLEPTSESGMYSPAFAGFFGGDGRPQYVPGYGVIFRKGARLNTLRAFTAQSRHMSREEATDTSEAAARKAYQAHLDTLRTKTVQVLATYGPTLTALKDDDWVGVYYDVGSAAALLNAGVDNYLVQARMRDIRQAAAQGDAAGWLASRVVTNEKGG